MPLFPDHQPNGRVHAVHVAGQLQRRLPGQPLDGRRLEQHRQDPEAVRRPRPVPGLPDSPGPEVHPLSWNHP